MADLLYDYEQASTRGAHRPPASSQGPSAPAVSGYVNASSEDDTPILTKQRINFNPQDAITHLVVCNNSLVMAMSSNILLRIDLEKPDAPDEIELRQVNDRIYNLFQDPTGRHVLVSMKSGDNFYLSRAANKPRSLGRLHGHQISAVGWNRQNVSDSSTGEILLGTAKGLILEAEITTGEDNRFFQSHVEQYVRQLFNLSRDKVYPVTGLEFEKMPSTSLTEYRYFVMATLPGRLYQFVGSIPTSTEPPIFANIFSRYEDMEERFLEIPGNFGYSELRFFHHRYRAPPKQFAWMTGPGIYYGNIDVHGGAVNDSPVTTDTKLMQYPREDDKRPVSPLSIVMTEFHVLVLFPDRLKAMCILNEQMVYDDIYTDKFGKLLGMVKDPLKGTIWTYTSEAVYKYKLVRESRDVWKMYLDSDEFELAKQHCSESPANLDRVLTKQAEFFFRKRDYVQSAETYALTQNSFEEVTLKFIQLAQKNALQGFLVKKLECLKHEDKMQTTMIVVWLVEIFLNQLGQLKEEGEEMSEKYESLQEEFYAFLRRPALKDCLSDNRAIVYDLIASHGAVENMVFFAIQMRDFERVITHHLQQENFRNALVVLAQQTDRGLFYKFSPILMQNIPKETVDAWIAKKELLMPKRLIPALVQYDQYRNRAGNEAIRYLEFCIQVLDVRDQAIHNYLISLYAKLGREEQLLKYLNFQGTDPDHVCYDLKYALRLCSEHELSRSCVHIYSTMALYEEAVDLALGVDVNLAKQNANCPDQDEELKKKLWLKIARHVVEKKEDIRAAMEFLEECELLKIEDILPFFPDFVTIDHFKDAICGSLADYNKHIEELKVEMEEATESAKEIRGEINAFRNKFSSVEASDKCASCGYPLMTRSFYLFPCMHRFHSDCLIAEVSPHLSSRKRGRVDELHRKLASREHSAAPMSGQAGLLQSGDLSVKEELDDLVAGECFYCGDIMVRCVDKPFIDEDEQSFILDSWL